MRRVAVCLAVPAAFFLALVLGRLFFKAVPIGATSRPTVETAAPPQPEVQEISTVATSADAAAAPSIPELSPPPGVAFVPATYDFGKLMEGEARVCSLAIMRLPGTPIKLGRIHSPCPCISVVCDKRQFKAEESINVVVGIHTLSLEGNKSFPVFAEVLEPVPGVLRGDVTVEVKRTPAKISLHPESFSFGSVCGDKRVSVKLLNLTKVPLRLSNPSCSIEGVKVSIPESGLVGPGQSASISVEIPSSGLPTGSVRGVVLLETDCTDHNRIAIPVDGTSLGEAATKN